MEAPSRQNPSMEKGDGHDVSPPTKQLQVTDSYWERVSFCKDVTFGWLTIL